MNKKFEYEAILEKGPHRGTYLEFPFNSTVEFGTRKPVPVIVTFDGHRFEMNLMPRGNDRHWLHLRNEIKETIGKNEGDSVLVTIEKNNAPKQIEIPDYLLWFLENDPELMKAFRKMSASTKKFWVKAIDETKKEETKVERINKFLDFLNIKN